tara:strand:+ start:1674 stop:2204 length:531 start_codon:yes stop_codon:yes gene_type:complete
MLEKLAKHHDLWLKMLINLGCDIETSKDLVQDMYLKLHRLVKDTGRIMYRGDVNRYYVYTTLRNLYYSHLTQKRKSIFYEMLENDDIARTEYNLEEDNAFSKMMDNVNNIVSKWTVYDRRLFELYFIQGLSLRSISKGANIGLNSIHNSIIGYRAILRQHLSEDLIDYFNQDFEKI